MRSYNSLNAQELGCYASANNARRARPPVTFTGVWRGWANITSCSDDGVFAGICQQNSATQYGGAFALTLVQVGNTVTGTGEWAWLKADITGSVSGSRLTNVRGRANISNLVEAGFEDWDTTISSNTMNGTFTVRHFPRQNGVQGGVRWRLVLVGVTSA